MALCLITPLWLVACGHTALQDAERLAQSGQHEVALQRLQGAQQATPDDTRLTAALAKQRETTVAALLYEADLARAAGQWGALQQVLARLEVAAPQHPRTQGLRQDIARRDRIQRLVQEAQRAQQRQDMAATEAAWRAVLADEPAHQQARRELALIDEQRQASTRQRSALVLAAADRPITLEFREATLRTVFETLARAAGLNFVFDKDVRAEAKVTLFLRDTQVHEALRVILSTQQLGHKLLNERTVLVFPGTPQKQRELLDTVTRSFYLTSADPKQVQSLIRTMAKSRDIHVDERLNLVVVRDTPEVIRLVERLVASVDLPDPEVMLELEVMEVSSSREMDLGLSWPGEYTYGLPGANAATALTSAEGLRVSVPNPLSVARLRSSVDASNLLANPRIRARNREKARILLGEKVPVFTTTATANVGVSASVSYQDVGLKLELEPMVQLDDEVTIKVGLEVSSITSTVMGPSGSTAYQIGTRQASTSLRLRDGETQVLAGLINDTESRSGAGLPYVNETPVVGRLFGSRKDAQKKTEVVLLITPRVVRNLHQQSLPVSPMPSGTESQPGAAPWQLGKGQVGGSPSGAGAATAGAPRAAASGKGMGPVEAGLFSGPEQVQAGGGFTLGLNNRSDTPVVVTLQYDPSVLLTPEGSAATGLGAGPLTVPPRGRQAVAFTVRPGTPAGPVTIGSSTGEQFTFMVFDPQAMPQGSAEPLPEPAERTTEPEPATPQDGGR
ncbi:general secretion pathway protein GspD [Aquabacterium lacunae]|uniref:General secretion pathway protein GspD n=1 Tax=Aquabacterium lacunae TaxID=2528630 RepID=A0A4V2JFH3_9BURK|nr:secretin N-terminal domain-containing protein [Aquabacterium lacunae]TBO29428.1 general secretion pathway protein GspD [Aquabacterium lacunae]